MQKFIDFFLQLFYNKIIKDNLKYTKKGDHQMMKSLREKVMELNNERRLTEGREKGENLEIVGKVLTIVDFDIVCEEQKNYAVYIVKELPNLFFFGGMVLTEHLKELEKEGYKEEIQKEGLPIKITTQKSKAGRNYFSVEFYPNK